MFKRGEIVGQKIYVYVFSRTESLCKMFFEKHIVLNPEEENKVFSFIFKIGGFLLWVRFL